jgi:Tripartite tricarboxylate transporter family receptor
MAWLTDSITIARKSVPANDLKELLAWLKGNPGKVTAGHAGVGSMEHVGAKPRPLWRQLSPEAAMRGSLTGIQRP